MNQQAVLEALLRSGPASRATLAKGLGLSAPTIGKVAAELLDLEMIEEVDEAEVTVDMEVMPGRPGRLLRVNQRVPRIAVVQIGVRHTRLAALPPAGPIDESWPVQFKTPKTAAAWGKALISAASRLQDVDPWVVMVSVPGAVDEKAGKVLLSPNLHWLVRAELHDLVGKCWSSPVHLVQEIRALAAGQVQAGEREDFLLVDIGEGVGAAAVIQGRLYNSTLPLTGELGHTPVRGNDRRCGCGGVGCLETLLSRKGLLASMAGATRSRSCDSWQDVQERIQKHGLEDWLTQTLDAAAMVMAGAINMMGVRKVIITGALAELPGEVMVVLQEALNRHAMWGRFGHVTCIASTRKRAAGLVALAVDGRLKMPMPGEGSL